MALSRRELLIRSAQLGVASGVLPLFSGFSLKGFAEEIDVSGPPHFFVMVRTFGGLDATLGLDPQILPEGADEKDLFLEYKPADIFEAGEIRLGPAAKPLHDLAKDKAFSVINGISMRRDAGHFSLNQYALTGRGDGKAAALPVELACTTGAGPFGVLMNEGTYLADRNVVLSSTRDLINDTDSEALVALLEQEHVDAGTPLGQAKQSIVEAKPSALAMSERLKRFKEKGEVTDTQAVAAAFASDAARQAQLDFSNFGLDTHSNHEGNHLRLQTQVWEKVAGLLKLFQETSYGGSTLFDHTTFMVITEFSRTPFLNGAKGKDHNPYTNSIFLAGKNIIGGRVVGATRLVPRGKATGGSAIHSALPLPFDTEKKTFTDHRPATNSKGSRFIFPENVIQTVAAAFGSPKGFSSVDSSTAPLFGIVQS